MSDICSESQLSLIFRNSTVSLIAMPVQSWTTSTSPSPRKWQRKEPRCPPLPPQQQCPGVQRQQLGQSQKSSEWSHWMQEIEWLWLRLAGTHWPSQVVVKATWTVYHLGREEGRWKRRGGGSHWTPGQLGWPGSGQLKTEVVREWNYGTSKLPLALITTVAINTMMKIITK